LHRWCTVVGHHVVRHTLKYVSGHEVWVRWGPLTRAVGHVLFWGGLVNQTCFPKIKHAAPRQKQKHGAPRRPAALAGTCTPSHLRAFSARLCAAPPRLATKATPEPDGFGTIHGKPLNTKRRAFALPMRAEVPQPIGRRQHARPAREVCGRPPMRLRGAAGRSALTLAHGGVSRGGCVALRLSPWQRAVSLRQRRDVRSAARGQRREPPRVRAVHDRAVQLRIRPAVAAADKPGRYARIGSAGGSHWRRRAQRRERALPRRADARVAPPADAPMEPRVHQPAGTGRAQRAHNGTDGRCGSACAARAPEGEALRRVPGGVVGAERHAPLCGERAARARDPPVGPARVEKGQVGPIPAVTSAT
jgi:hypothetical protein